MNLGIAGSTIQMPVLALLILTVAPVVLFFGILKIKSEINKRKHLKNI